MVDLAQMRSLSAVAAVQGYQCQVEGAAATAVDVDIQHHDAMHHEQVGIVIAIVLVDLDGYRAEAC